VSRSRRDGFFYRPRTRFLCKRPSCNVWADGPKRTLTVDLKVRPIHQRTADRVRAHILLCLLTYYVEWHMREAWRELMFADTDLAAKATRDPVAPTQHSEAALAKAARHTLDDVTPAHGFSTLMAELATIVRNTCRTPGSRRRPSTSSPRPAPCSAALLT